VAVAERDLAEQEVLLELVHSLPGRRPHLPERVQGPAAFDEELMGGDHFLRNTVV
jgi:hypothetical protein